MTIEKQHLTINPYSRPGKALTGVRAIVMHWVANPATSPHANRDFFESRKNEMTTYGSAHYIVGIDGDVVECIPPTEVAFHVGSPRYTRFTRDCLTGGNPNLCTLGIELCHPRPDGAFTDETLQSASALAAGLCEDFHLNPYRDITTHKGIVGWKDCPRYWCDNPGEFQRFQRMTAERMGLL